MYINIYAYINIHIDICIYIHKYICLDIYVFKHIYVCKVHFIHGDFIHIFTYRHIDIHNICIDI